MNKWYLIAGLVVIVLVVCIVMMQTQGNNGGKAGANTLMPNGQNAETAGGPAPAAAPQPATTPGPRPTVTKPTAAEVAAAKAAGTRHATITTDKGVIEVDLFGADEPLTVANFVKLAKAKFYDGLIFHRVEPGFVIQGGDPEGTGMGGPGYTINLEVSPKHKHIEGALAMASTSAPNSAGSQFYITLAPAPSLDGKYAVFGQVTKGMDVVKNIAKGDKMLSIVVK
jgi:peptidyl-prolyl cis-trans isomerase B (cyclophilin B)